MDFFDRRIRLTIQIDTELVTYEESDFLEGNLAIDFDVRKSADNYTSQSHIMIKGLNLNDASFLATAYDLQTGEYKRGKIKLEAGYRNNLSRIAEGDIIACKGDFTSPDISVELDAISGAFNNQEQKEESISVQNTPLGDILKRVADLNNMDHEISSSLASKLIPIYSYYGKPFSHVENFTNTFSNLASIYVDKDKIFVIPEGELPLSGSIYELSAESGLIGVPTYSPAGCEMTCLLNPNIKVNDQIILNTTKTPQINGKYRIITLQMRGGNRSPEFYNQMIGRKL